MCLQLSRRCRLMRFSKQITGAVTAVALLLLLGCSAKTGGRATAVPENQAFAAPEVSDSKPGAFDPCDLPSALLEDIDLSGVAPIPVSHANGCIWGNERIAVSLILIEDTTFVQDPASSAMVSELEMLPYENYTTYLFVLGGDTYTTQTMTKVGALTMTLVLVGATTMDVERQAMVDTFTALAPYLPPPQ